MKGQLAFSSTLSCTSRLNSRLSVVEILNCLSCVSRILNIVSTVKCLSTPCRRLSLIFSIFMLVSMMKATFQRIIHRFLRMLEDGTYREHREVSYYVDCLCITSKYLSEVLKKVSRYAANYWINRYTIFDISRLLSDKSLSFVQISDMFSFSSQAYLSRYVQQNLGFNPTEYRT